MDKATVLNLISDARAKGDLQEVRRLQTYLPINRALFEGCLVPLFGKEEVAELLDEMEKLKLQHRAEYEKAVPA